MTPVRERPSRPSCSETSTVPSAQRLDDALARDQKWDTRISTGEKELWDRAAQTVGLTTSEYVRGVVNRAAEEVLAATYATE